ncbi:MAG: helix-turn-helix domain-containing protein [Bacteroidales bacterium]
MIDVIGKKFLTVKEVANLLGFHRNTIYKFIKQKKIRFINLFGRFYIDKDYLESIINGGGYHD